VPNCKPVLATGNKRKHVRRRAQFGQHRDASCHRDFFFLQGKAPRNFTLFLQKHYGNMQRRMPPSKTGWPSLNVVIFPPVFASSWTTQNKVHIGDYLSFSRANLGRRQISSKSIAEQLSILRERVRSIIHEVFFSRRGGHCCPGDLVGRTSF
jgi:hypothetical protein